jgi:hypothetical protein
MVFVRLLGLQSMGYFMQSSHFTLSHQPPSHPAPSQYRIHSSYATFLSYPCHFLQFQKVFVKMVEILLSPESKLVFDIKAMTDVVQSSTSLLYDIDSTNSVLIYEVQSNCMSSYTISPSVGALRSNYETCFNNSGVDQL